MSILNRNSTTNYWWDCPSCGTTKISSVLHGANKEILGMQMCCPECSYVMRGDEHTYVDEEVYEIPEEWIEKLQTPRWKCQECGGLNEKPSDILMQNLTVNDLYCQHCETWQCDIPGTPAYDPDEKLKREAKIVEAKSRWENPIEPIELIEDKYRFEEKYSIKNTSVPKLKTELPKIQFSKAGIIALAGALAIGGLGFASYDGLRTREMVAEVTAPEAVSTIRVERYSIVTREGWSPNYSAPDFRLLSQETRQNGTREVPDRVETYFETERYLARYETKTSTTTESYQVQSGTKQECVSVQVGATSEQRCNSVPVYTTQTRPVTQTTQEPVYETRQVPKTRQLYRTEPVYATYYRWQQGVWQNETTLKQVSNTFDIKHPDISSYQNQGNLRTLPPQTSCSVKLNSELGAERKNIDCTQFVTLENESAGIVTYSKWRGVKSIEVLE